MGHNPHRKTDRQMANGRVNTLFARSINKIPILSMSKILGPLGAILILSDWAGI